jgi:hypothetical protein
MFSQVIRDLLQIGTEAVPGREQIKTPPFHTGNMEGVSYHQRQETAAVQRSGAGSCTGRKQYHDQYHTERKRKNDLTYDTGNNENQYGSKTSGQ